MSISPQLQASARAAYRSVSRAARFTFAGTLALLLLIPFTDKNVKATLKFYVVRKDELSSCKLLIFWAAFMVKTRNDFVTARSHTDETAYAESVKFANDVAEVLRKNIVQGYVSTSCKHIIVLTLS